MKKLFLMTVAVLALGTSISFAEATKQVVELTVTEKGFEPSAVNVKPQVPVTLKITRKTASTCATQIQIPAKKIKKELPLEKTVTVDLGKLAKGEIRFACGMDMVTGLIIVK